MSTVIKSNNALVFGNQSSFINILTEPGLKDSFLRLLVDSQSKTVRRRGFQTYMLANEIFPNNSIAINDNIKYGISQLLTPFIKLGIKNDIDSIIQLKRPSFIQGEISLTNSLVKATKIKNMLVMAADNEKNTFSNRKGITTYITRKFSECENQSLDAGWSNGFFTFQDPSSLSILIVIPKQYIANLIINVNTFDNYISTPVENNMAYLEAVKSEFIVDLLKSFFAAIYADSFKHRVNSDISSLNTILQEAGQALFTSSYDNEELLNSIASAYRKKLKEFKSVDCENLIYECLKLIMYKPHVIINPYEFYNTFIDIPYQQLKAIFARIPRIHTASKSVISGQISESDFSNNLRDMNTFFEDENRDALIYGLKLIRFLPFFIFNTYIIGGGNYHSRFLVVLNNIKSIISTINNFKNSHVLYAPIGTFIVEELDYLINVFFPQMNSPLKVNNKSIHLIAGLINQSFSDDIRI
jgi:hypothetical protein